MIDQDHSTHGLKAEVKAFWERGACGEVYCEGGDAKSRLEAQARRRYELEPYLEPFARFHEGCGKDVLEIGVGMGADHLEWAKARPRSLCGVDLTERAVAFTRERLAAWGYESNLQVADAEKLPFPNNAFDIVYSWGVLHHSPNTPGAIEEVYRVLRPGGLARIMIYHSHSLIGAMLWARYGLMRGQPRRSLQEIYANHLESPGTKAYSVAEARRLFGPFLQANIRSQLGPGDMLEGEAGQRHRGPLLTTARRLWPRTLIRRYGNRFGLDLLIEARK